MAIARPTELLDTYYARVLGIAFQVLGDAALAARAAETIFGRLVRSGHDEAPAVWMTTVKVLRSYLERGLRIEPLASDAAGWQAPLLDGLAELDPAERILLILRYHEGLRYDQLVQVLDSDMPTVRRDVARARNRLMDVLGLRNAVR